MPLPDNYAEKVYAGVLGKLIGVYLGRPIEGWSCADITREFGEVDYYLHERRQMPLIVTDDDITGAFTFLRALPDYGNRRDLSPAQIGQSWLNYIIENRTILWWGGLGHSTEHTAFIRLKNGIAAPRSGSMALNGQIIAEQIGAQIFIDGWAMVAPGDPALAADLARRAASVSHDGEAIYAAQVIAAMEAQAFVQPDIQALLDTGLAFIPPDSVIHRLISDIRAWRAQDNDWRKTRQRIEERYGYDKYGGNCHVVPNHALIILALVYCDDDFQKGLRIVNTSGWDTDCNSGNVGCLLGIKNGLAGLETGPDWRGPVADRMYLPTADGGSAITDALSTAYQIINSGRALAGLEPAAPKDGARFHFSLPGALQGFQAEDSPECRGTLTLKNAPWPADANRRALALRYQHVASGRPARAATATFIPQEFAGQKLHYELIASPSLHPGQYVRARLAADARNAQATRAGLYVRHYNAQDTLSVWRGPVITLAPGASQEIGWRIPDLGGQPLAEVGVEITSPARAEGALYLDYLTWDGEPQTRLGRPAASGDAWRQAWVKAVDDFHSWKEPYILGQNHGAGMISQGGRGWRDYEVETTLSLTLAAAAGLAARVQGLERYYALLIGSDRRARLVKALDGRRVLAETDFPFKWEERLRLKLAVKGTQLRAWLNGQLVFEVDDEQAPLLEGGVALLVEEGRIQCGEVSLTPAA